MTAMTIRTITRTVTGLGFKPKYIFNICISWPDYHKVSECYREKEIAVNEGALGSPDIQKKI